MGIADKEGSLPLFDMGILNFFFFSLSLIAEITARLMGKIGPHIPAAEVLKRLHIC